MSSDVLLSASCTKSLNVNASENTKTLLSVDSVESSRSPIVTSGRFAITGAAANAGANALSVMTPANRVDFNPRDIRRTSLQNLKNNCRLQAYLRNLLQQYPVLVP